jgi:hypothetical protein
VQFRDVRGSGSWFQSGSTRTFAEMSIEERLAVPGASDGLAALRRHLEI